MTAIDRPVALVTGGARGIGRALVHDLARRGFAVAFNYHRSAEAAETLQAELREQGVPVMARAADVSDQTAVRELFAELRRTFGRLDVLVNNAGILHEGAFFLTDYETFSRVMAVNVGGVYHCCKVALPLLAGKRKGRIINIASIAAMHGTEGLSAYAASKAAVIALTKVLSRELAASGVPVNAVAPGLVDTDMPGQMRPEALQRAIASQPVSRLGTPEEVARVVGFLATEAPTYLTGEVIRVDGGAMIG